VVSTILAVDGLTLSRESHRMAFSQIARKKEE